MWTKGKCPVLWDEGYKDFNYVRQPITGAESDAWRKQGYTHENTTGKMYDSRNPMPEYAIQVAQLLNLHNPGFVFYKMDTCLHTLIIIIHIVKCLIKSVTK